MPATVENRTVNARLLVVKVFVYETFADEVIACLLCKRFRKRLWT